MSPSLIYMVAFLSCGPTKCETFFPFPNEHYATKNQCEQRLVGKPDLGELAFIYCVSVESSPVRAQHPARHHHVAHVRHNRHAPAGVQDGQQPARAVAAAR
jgi:hypothetical protein